MLFDEQKIFQALTQLKAKCETQNFDIKDLRIVLFSDHHKGRKDGADDFKNCKAAYHAALGYYLSAGYSLYLLGDVEELWECRPDNVIKNYADTFKLEQEFAKRGKYTRLIGNHDDLWQYPSEVDRYLKQYLMDGDIHLAPAVCLAIYDQDIKLGELFLLHGHQGTSASDRFSGISCLFVRYIWRNLQRLTRIRSTSTPAWNFELRGRHEHAFFNWASQQAGLILIAGHTHHPVFSSESHESFLMAELNKCKNQLECETEAIQRSRLQQDIHYLQAELHWVLAKSDGQIFDVANAARPCYFNTGCCCFSDGDITGIEIENGSIRLVRWPRELDTPRQKLLRQAGLPELFRLCG